MAATGTPPTGKKGKKKSKNTKTLSLNDFLGDISSPGVINWADETEEEGQSVNSSLAYQSTSNPRQITLPTAPRAARSVSVDASRIPENGPYKAFVGNLPYEANDDMLHEFFKGLDILNVRLPEENGRFKGFGYVEFADKANLIKALEMNEETFQRRTIRIDIADNQNKADSGPWGRDRYGSNSSGPDPTAGNWRRSSQETTQSSFDRRDNDYRGMDRHRGDSYGDYGHGDRYGDQRRQRYYGHYDRGQRPSNSRGSSRDYGSESGSWRSGFSSDQYQRRPSDDRYNSGYSRDRGYNRQRSGDYNQPQEPSRERPQLKLQPRQKPVADENASTRSSSIFGSAKPVDTTAKEREIEEKIGKKETNVKEPVAEKKSTNIFGSAKPVDTAAREREMEEKIAAQEREILELAKQKSPTQPKSVSVFGDAKPVDTAARERAIEEKLRRQEQQYLQEFGDDRGEPQRNRGRRTSERSDDYQVKSPRRSRTSSTRSSEDQDVVSPQGHGSRKPSGSEQRKAEYKPAPVPKESPWGKKKFTSDQAPSGGSPPNAWKRDEPKNMTEHRGEREEAEGNCQEEEEDRRPEGAAVEESSLQARNEPGDGRESIESAQQQPRTHYAANRQPPTQHDRRSNERKYSDRGGGMQGRRPYQGGGRGQASNRDQDFHANRRRGDGDSESYRGDRHQTSNRNRRENRGSRSDASERKRDSSGDSRPECDRPDAPGQEQPTRKPGKQQRLRPAAPPVANEQPVNFVTHSKFALLAVDDSDDDAVAE
uniref:Eukaryotic translation initiation factor 4B n=1 Tax=Phallusia mammillata TaxID=59560 RepID=A0A6F9DB73_9ASCI|nr:eukaryotic translation initiation factor 4B [Phallusia mammillata]